MKLFLTVSYQMLVSHNHKNDGYILRFEDENANRIQISLSASQLDFLINDAIKNTEQGHRKIYVLIKWGAYHDLRSHSNSGIFESLSEAERHSEPGDQIWEFKNRDLAEKYVCAFEKFLEGAWTPNQTPEDREYFGNQIDASCREMDECEISGKRVL